MNVRLRPTSTISPRRSTVIVTDGPGGTSTTVVTGSAAGACPCARAVAATANMAVALISARRPTTLGDVFCISVLARSRRGHVTRGARVSAERCRRGRALRSAALAIIDPPLQGIDLIRDQRVVFGSAVTHAGNVVHG